MNVHNTSIDLNIYICNCEFGIKFNHATHGNTNCFTLTIRFKKQCNEMKEANELSHQIDEIEQGESGYIFDSIKKLVVETYRYHDIRVSSHCKVPEPFWSSKSIVNRQNHDNYYFVWSILAHKNKVHNHRERVSQYQKHFHELNQGDIHFPLKKGTYQYLKDEILQV